MLKDSQVVAVLPSADIDNTKKFYMEKLKLQALDVPTPGKDIFFKAGKGTYLYLYEREAGTKAEHTVATFVVNDIEEAVEELRGRGVEFAHYDMPGLKTDESGIAELEVARGAWFKDPEGNIIAITEPPVPLP